MIRHRIIAASALCIAVVAARSAWSDAYDPPAGYYSSATGTGATLKSQLMMIMSTGHIQRTYGNFRDSAAIHDADPNNPGNILTVYNRQSVSATWDSGATWDREHIWPDSRQPGNADNSEIGNIADPHALRPCIPFINQSRGNKAFGFETNTGAHGSVDANYYFPGDVDKGDVARQLFYSDVRWASDGLSLTDALPSGYQMGDLSSLVAWHYLDVPDEFERRRNHAIYSSALNPLFYTNNRSAFVDRPEFVWSVYVDQLNDSQITIAGGTTDGNGGSTRNVDLGRVFVGSAVPAAQSFTLNKSSVDGAYYEVTAAGAATSSLSGRYNAFRTGQADSRSINVGLNASTAIAGLRSGTVTVDNLDITTGGCGGAGCGANDGNDTFNVSLTVLDHATPSFESGSNVASRSLNFGTVTTASMAQSLEFFVFNQGTDPAFTASMDFDSLLSSGDTGALSTDAGALAGSLVLASGASQMFSAILNTTAAGTFEATYTLRFSDENIAGAQNNKDITLSLSGTVVLAGDFNRDGVVDTSDYIVWKKSNNTGTVAYSDADADGSGFVDTADLAWWTMNFGQVASGVGGSQQVPEPSTALFVAITFVALNLLIRVPNEKCAASRLV